MTAFTARLAFEPLEARHAEALVEALAHPAVDEFLDEPAVTTVAALLERIEHLTRGPTRADERWLNFALRRRADDLVVGWLQATAHAEWAEVAYLLDPRAQGQGLATEAVRWLRAHLGLDELWATVNPRNTRSIALLQRLGFAQRDTSPRHLSSWAPGDACFVWLSTRAAAR